MISVPLSHSMDMTAPCTLGLRMEMLTGSCEFFRAQLNTARGRRLDQIESFLKITSLEEKKLLI